MTGTGIQTRRAYPTTIEWEGRGEQAAQSLLFFDNASMRCMSVSTVDMAR